MRFASLVVSSGLLLALLPRAARACSCAEPETEAWPADGAEGVPLDVTPVLRYPAGGEGVLLLVDEETGEAVPGTVEVVETGGEEFYARFRPESALEPGHAYVLADGTVEARFTTGETAGEAPPSPPEFLSFEAQGSRFDDPCGAEATSSCDPYVYLAVRAEAPSPDTRVEVEATAWGETVVVLGDADGGEVGYGACLYNFPETLHADAVAIRVRSVDLAGRTSDWVDAGRILLGSPDGEDSCPESYQGGGCAAAPVGGAWLAWLAAVALARRRSASG